MGKTRKADTAKKEDDASPNGSGNKAWKVAIYLSADNTLREESIFMLTEMLKARKTPGVDICAQLDYDFKTTKYEFGDQAKKLGTIAAKENRGVEKLEQIIEDQTKVPVKSARERLKEYLSFELDKDAKYNMVVLSGHGNGAVGNFLGSEHSSLTIPALKTALSAVTSDASNLQRPIDILGIDSCLMSMVEVCFEVRKSAKYIVGAEGFARSTGWPYREVLEIIKENPGIEPEPLACNIVKSYVHYYAPYTRANVSVDHAVCKLAKIEDMAKALGALSTKLVQVLKHEKDLAEDASGSDRERKLRQGHKLRNILVMAHWRSQSYKFEQYVDLWDFCNELKWFTDKTEYQEISNLCGDVQAALNRVVVLSCYSGSEFQHSHGLSIYFPWSITDLERNIRAYKRLEFESFSHWGAFLKIYADLTLRETRENDKNKGGESRIESMPVEYDLGLLPLLNVRTNFIEGTKTNFVEGTMTNFVEGTMTNFVEGTMGGLIVPKVKNPPVEYFKFEDDCKTEFE